MPSILIEVQKPYSPEQGIELMKAVRQALVDTFQTTEEDINVRLIVHEPHRFLCPPDKSKPDLYTHIFIDAFEGRTVETKKDLHQHIIQNLTKLGIPSDHIKIMLREMVSENKLFSGKL